MDSLFAQSLDGKNKPLVENELSVMGQTGKDQKESHWKPNEDLSDDPEAIKARLATVRYSDLTSAVEDVKDTMGDLAGWDQSQDPEAAETRKHRHAKQQRIEKFLNSRTTALQESNPELASMVQTLNKISAFIVTITIYTILPFYVALYLIVYRILAVLPWNMLQMIFGITLCFFGGDYPLCLAAFEAFWNMGGYRCVADMEYVVAMAKEVADADDKDDAGWDNLGLKDIIQLQMKIAMIQVKDPARLVQAVGNLWSAFTAVIMVLKLRFAFLIALSLGIASLLEFPVLRLLGPPLSAFLGKDLQHWTYTLLTSILKIVSIFVAFWVATIVVAYYSALRGGDLFAEGLLSLLDHWGCLQPVLHRIFPSTSRAEDLDPDDYHIGEVFHYGVAALGFWTQWRYAFRAPFPFSVFLFPVGILEGFLKSCLVMIDTNQYATTR